MDKGVNFETAKLLWEKGMREKCDEVYTFSKRNDNTEDLQEDKNDHYEISWLEQCNELTKGWQWNYPKPSIAKVVMWLYEKHGIWINVSITIQKVYYYQCLDITGIKDLTGNNYPSRICKPVKYFNSPTEAYEASIEYTLKNLI